MEKGELKRLVEKHFFKLVQSVHPEAGYHPEFAASLAEAARAFVAEERAELNSAWMAGACPKCGPWCGCGWTPMYERCTAYKKGECPNAKIVCTSDCPSFKADPEYMKNLKAGTVPTE